MHSTALLKVQNDLRSSDNGQTTVPVLLDFLEAFDTLDTSVYWRTGMVSLEMPSSGLPHIWWIDSKWLKSKITWVDLPNKVWSSPGLSPWAAPFHTLYTTPHSKIISRHNLIMCVTIFMLMTHRSMSHYPNQNLICHCHCCRSVYST